MYTISYIKPYGPFTIREDDVLVAEYGSIPALFDSLRKESLVMLDHNAIERLANLGA